MESDKKKFKEEIKKLAEKYRLDLILLFGSQVSGKTHPLSDFDFGFISEKELGYRQRSKLARDLSTLVGFSNVEEVDLRKAGPFLLKEIIKNNEVVFEKEGAYPEFFSRAVRTYFEAKPIFELQKMIYSNVISKYRKKYAE